jgi:hypothetical protein
VKDVQPRRVLHNVTMLEIAEEVGVTGTRLDVLFNLSTVVRE